jgi:hypothetical protein
LFFLDSFVCNLNETYYHSSTVVERWICNVGITIKHWDIHNKRKYDRRW